MSLRAITGCAVLAVVVAVSPSAAGAGETVALRVGCVLASNTGQEFDQRLIELQGRFNRLFRYTSYALVKEQREKVAMGGKLVFNVPGGRYLMILPKEYNSDGTVLMKVVLLEGARPIINTAISLKKHATFLVGGPQNNDGALILAIAADEVTEDGK
jgi:hypothetical protein